MEGYQHLSRDERVKIEHMLEERASVRRIAHRLRREPSTICRELQRNRNADGSYRGTSAQQRAERRTRGHPPRKIRPPTLAEPQGNAAWRFVLSQLQDEHWSPQLIAGRLKLTQPHAALCQETVYRFIYHPQQRRERLWLHLSEQRATRRQRGPRAMTRAKFTRGPSIELRPAAANARLEPGHWEGDLVCFSRPGAVILHLADRFSRFRFALKLASKHSAELMQRLSAALATFPSILRETLTVDNGSEFASWPAIWDSLGLPTYFCAPYAAWQKGTLESLNRQLRRYLPRSSDLTTLDQEELTDICEELNDRPMAVLGYRTPREVLHSELGLSVALHL